MLTPDDPTLVGLPAGPVVQGVGTVAAAIIALVGVVVGGLIAGTVALIVARINRNSQIEVQQLNREAQLESQAVAHKGAAERERIARLRTAQAEFAGACFGLIRARALNVHARSTFAKTSETARQYPGQATFDILKADGDRTGKMQDAVIYGLELIATANAKVLLLERVPAERTAAQTVLTEAERLPLFPANANSTTPPPDAGAALTTFRINLIKWVATQAERTDL